MFQRNGKGYDLTSELYAPDHANKSISELQMMKANEHHEMQSPQIQIRISDPNMKESGENASGPFGRPGFRRL